MPHVDSRYSPHPELPSTAMIDSPRVSLFIHLLFRQHNSRDTHSVLARGRPALKKWFAFFFSADHFDMAVLYSRPVRGDRSLPAARSLLDDC